MMMMLYTVIIIILAFSSSNFLSLFLGAQGLVRLIWQDLTQNISFSMEQLPS